MNIQQGYCGGREALAKDLLNTFADAPRSTDVIRRILWSPAWCETDGTPHAMFPGALKPHRVEVIGFEPAPQLMQRTGVFLRVNTTTNWFLSLQDFPGSEAYFKSISKKLRKNLRWLDNVYQREPLDIVPIKNKQDMQDFLDIFQIQWPDSDWVGRHRDLFIRIYLYLEQTRRNGSYLIRESESNKAVAGALGYLTDYAYNLNLLARRPGMFDKYSPGNYLAFWIIKNLLESSGHPAFFIFGPGEFEYKKRFLAKALPVYRYERITPANIHGLVRMINRWRKERYKRWKKQKSSVRSA